MMLPLKTITYQWTDSESDTEKDQSVSHQTHYDVTTKNNNISMD
jgi:hypothetical protein